MSGPLTGLRVVDLTQMLAGPFCTMLLADLGADVVKVEPPAGDLTRTLGPYLPDDTTRAFGGYFQSVNRNKRSIVIDLKSVAGREILLRLIEGADVLVENFRVGVMDRLGLSYESLHEKFPKLVYGCVRGFGDPRTGESPYAKWPAFDIIAQSFGGLIGITGSDPEHPVKAGPGLGDMIPATLAAFGILAAVRHADKTGRGQLVDVAMYDGVLALTERIIFQYGYAGIIDRPAGNSHPMICPFDAFRTRDGWVTIAAPGETLWAELCRAIGRPELASDPEFTAPRRAGHRGPVMAILEEWTLSRTKQEVLDTLGGRVPCAPIHTVEDIFRDPHVAAREMIVALEHPGSSMPGRVSGIPVKLSETPGAIDRRAPLLGEQTEEILRAIGCDAPEIESLRSARVVR